MASRHLPTCLGPQPTPSTGFDLLGVPWIRALFRWSAFPYAVQAAFLAVFVLMAGAAWGDFPPPGVADKLYAKTHLVQLCVWGLWWPAMVWCAVLLGRVWCAVCPLELVTTLSERAARGLGVRQRTLGRWARSGALIVVAYMGIQMLIPGIHLHRIPAYTSVFLLGMLAAAVGVGVIFRDRAFCRGFCPVGMLLQTYGRGGALAVRSDSARVCLDCRGKDCVRAANRQLWRNRSCPSLLNPARLDESRDCLICGQCFGSCSHGNVRILLRRLFHEADTRRLRASWPVTLFVMLVSGFVTHEVTTEWPAAESAFLWVPSRLAPLAGLEPSNGWVQGAWTLIVYPAGLWSLLGALASRPNGAGGLTESWRRLALPLAVVVAAGHMAKGLAKVASWAGYLPGALREPAGALTSRGITAGTLPNPGPLLPVALVSLGGCLLLAAGAWFALREVRLTCRDDVGRAIVPVLVLTAILGGVVYGWGMAG